jgi:hypothetical protein
VKLCHRKNVKAICSRPLCMLSVSDVPTCDYVKYKTFAVLGHIVTQNLDAME